MVQLGGIIKGGGKGLFSILGFIKRHWYWGILIIILIPSIINSIQTAIQTDNPTYPFFDLATRIFLADQALDRDINYLRQDPTLLYGMAKPENGIWDGFKYYWFAWWKGWYSIISNLWLVFLPLVLTYKIVKSRNYSQGWNNLFLSSVIFLIYLFITNSIVLIHGLAVGNTLLTLPEDSFKSFQVIAIELIPLHGVGNLILYAFQKIIGV